MKITQTSFEGLVILEPAVFKDGRGFFLESYNKSVFKKSGIAQEFVQDNQSQSKKNVLRGLHFQKPPFAQAKLIRVLSGSIQDVVVDLRKSQPTFGEHFSIDITAESQMQLFVPVGFAHGFLVLSDQAEVLYKCDQFYHPESDAGIHFADPGLGIKWKVDPGQVIVSQKDALLPEFNSGVSFGF